jgi:tetratricopeptide (TPR) repeat protein
MDKDMTHQQNGGLEIIVGEDALKVAERHFLDGELTQAEELGYEVLHANPTNPKTYDLLGQIAYQAGRPAMAKEYFLTALTFAPDDGLVHRNLAFALDALGERGEACTQFREVLKINPDDDIAHLNLGLILKDELKLEQAYSHITKCTQLRGSDATATAELAAILIELKRYETALEVAKASCEMEANNSRALTVYAQALLLHGKPQEAEAITSRLVSIEPANAHAYSLHIEALAESGLMLKALAMVRMALQRFPRNHEVLCIAVPVLSNLGKWREAFATVEDALSQYPDDTDLLSYKSNILYRTGDKKGAFKIAQRLVKNREKARPQAFYLYLSLAPGNGEFDNADIYLKNLLQRIQQNKDTPHNVLLDLYFSAGDFYEKARRYDLAFSYYEKANTLKSREYEHESTSRLIHDLQKYVTANLYTEKHVSSNSSRMPIFIVGMPRSGTTLTEKILASHSRVFGAGELKKLNLIATQSLPALLHTDKGYPASLPLITRGIADMLASEYIEFIKALAPEGTEHVVSKMPHDFFHIGLILLLFPKAKIIHCSRNPLDTAVSIYSKNFSSNGLQYAYDLRNIGKFYCLYDELMQHWHRLFPGRIYDSNYESLVTNPETQIRALIEFCELKWEDACLSHHKSNPQANTASFDQVRNPIYTKSIRKWKNYEQHLNPLIEELENCRLFQKKTS